MDGDETRRPTSSTYQKWVDHTRGDRLPTSDDPRLHQVAHFLFAQLDEMTARVTALEEEMRIVRGANKLPGKA